MLRLWRIYKVFLSSSLARELEFRANFIAKFFQNLIWVSLFLLVLLVVYSNTDSVAGWNESEGYILASTTFLVSAFFGLFFRSLMEIPEHVRKGTMDFILTRPVDSQFWASCRRFNFDQLGSFTAGVILLAYGLSNFGGQISLLQWAGFGVLAVSAVAIFYAFNLCLMTLSIWFVRVDNLWVLSETVLDISRFPVDIFNISIQRGLTYVLPLAFLATIPARQLVVGFDVSMVLLGVSWAICALVFSRFFWRFALRFYTSASS